MQIWSAGRWRLTAVDLLRRIAAVLWSIQVDAAAEVEEDEVHCDGGGARSTGGLREEEDAGKEKNEERSDGPIYK